MKNINWVRKLTSRKLWAAVASFVSMIIVATGGAETTATQVTALIMAGASVIAYIIGEGLTDASNAGGYRSGHGSGSESGRGVADGQAGIY